MKFATLIQFSPDQSKVSAVRLAHRRYLCGLLGTGQLVAAGPLTGNTGAFWVLEAESADHARQIILADPSHAVGAIATWQIHPLAYWSAQACVGA